MNAAITALWIALAGGTGGQLTPLQLLDLNGASIDLFEDPEAVEVFVFIRSDCPISNRYAPEIERLAQEFRRPATRFWLVYVDAAEPADDIRRHRDEYHYTVPAVRDSEHRLVALVGAEVTPEAAVVVGSRLVYRGRIDDRYVAFGKARPEPTRRDLKEVMAALAAGRSLEPRTTPAIGCYIADLR